MSVFDGEIEFQSVYMLSKLADTVSDVVWLKEGLGKSDLLLIDNNYIYNDSYKYYDVRLNFHADECGCIKKCDGGKKGHYVDKQNGVDIFNNEDVEEYSILAVVFMLINDKSPRRKAVDDDCLIVGISRDSLKAKDQPRKSPDVLCPINFEYYKKAVERFDEDHPKLTKMYMSKDIDPTPIDHEIQDLKRTEYLTKYCSRELPFMSVNLARRARALQTLRLPDDIYIPDTSQKGSYRYPNPEKYSEPPSTMSMKPKLDPSLQKELRRILRVRTGDTSYEVAHGLLAQVVLEKSPFGPPREEPKYGRWKNPYMFTYRI